MIPKHLPHRAVSHVARLQLRCTGAYLCQGVREADFIPVVAWRQSADFVNRYLTKGSKVAVEGSMQVRSYDAQDGSKRYVTEVIADSVESLATVGDGQARAPSPWTTGPPPPAPPAGPAMNDFTEVEDDELPF